MIYLIAIVLGIFLIPVYLGFRDACRETSLFNKLRRGEDISEKEYNQKVERDEYYDRNQTF